MREKHDPSNDKLDHLLKAWADSSIADPSHYAKLLKRILAEVNPPLVRATPSRSAWPALVTAVAGLMLLFAAFSIPTSPRSTSLSDSADVSVAPRIGLPELWDRTAELFGSRLNWLCDLDDELLLGVDESAASTTFHDRAFVLLTVQVRDLTSSNWLTVWTGRLVCPLGEAVDFVSEKSQSGGTVWVQAQTDGRFTVSHWLNWPDHPEISGSLEVEVTSGETCVVAQRIENGRSIQVLQQIWTATAG